MALTEEQKKATFASVGDVIETNVQNPYPQTLRVRLSTPEACSYGNELIAIGRWRKTNGDKSETVTK